MSGLSRTPGKRVWDNIPTGVRIPPSPPLHCFNQSQKVLPTRTATSICGFFIAQSVLSVLIESCNNWGYIGGMFQFEKYNTPTLTGSLL